VTKLFGKPDLSWLVSALIACGLLAGAILVPLWRMELVAPQYPKGLVMYAYGYKFVDDPKSYYDDVREINELNHYIGMKKITTVNEMKMFIPGIAALIIGTLAVSFVAWKRRWAQGAGAHRAGVLGDAAVLHRGLAILAVQLRPHHG
jgi:hypothetical protein